MTPHVHSSMDSITIKPDTINVGYLGTKPVFRYSINTGIKRTVAISNNMNDMIEKNINGL